eukprot:ANDGO_08163.mRNA.1 Kinesin heavy chain
MSADSLAPRPATSAAAPSTGTPGGGGGGTSVRVVCRFRPQNKLELSKNAPMNVTFVNEMTVRVVDHEAQDFTFTFDRVFTVNAAQQEVYEHTGKPLLDSFFEGYNCTILSYGQTGSGKTHTMMGPSTSDKIMGYCDDPAQQGLIPRMANDIFSMVENSDDQLEFAIKVSYVEVYMEKVRDLISPEKTNLQIHEEKGGRGVFLADVTEVYVSSKEEMFQLMAEGALNRAVASTNMNERSSRSHCIFIITLSQKNLSSLEQRVSRLYLVDLAGSEKISKTGASGLTLDEAKMINKSLSTLGNVINALTDGKSSHVPYRDSKLTRLLQNSLGGNSRTLLCINCSPSMYNDAETISTLRFGQRAKSIKNKATINRQRTPEELEKALDIAEREIEKLQALLSKAAGGSTGKLEEINSQEFADLKAEIEQLKEELKDKSEESAAAKQLAAEFKVAGDRSQKEGQLLLHKLAEATLNLQKTDQEKAERAIEVSSLQSALQQTRTELEDLQRRVSESERKQTDVKLREEAVDEEFATLRLENKRLKEQLERTKDDSQWELSKLDATYKNKVSYLEKQLQETEDAKSSLQKRLADAEEQCMAIENRLIESNNRTVEKTETESQRYNEDRKVYERQIATLKGQLKESQEDQSLMSSELRRLREELSLKEEHFNSSRADLLKDLQNRCQKVIDLEMALDEARDQAQKMKVSANVKTLTKKISSLEESIEQLQVALRHATTENHNLRLELDLAQKKLDNRNDRIQNLEVSNASSQEEIRSLREQLSSIRDDLSPGAEDPLGALRKQHHPHVYKSLRGGSNARKLSGANAPPGRISPPSQRISKAVENAIHAAGTMSGSVIADATVVADPQESPPPSPTSFRSPPHNVSDEVHPYRPRNAMAGPTPASAASVVSPDAARPTVIQVTPESQEKKSFWGSLFSSSSTKKSPATSPMASHGISRSHSSTNMSSKPSASAEALQPMNAIDTRTYMAPPSPARAMPGAESSISMSSIPSNGTGSQAGLPANSRRFSFARKAQSLASPPQGFESLDADEYQSADVSKMP